MKNQKLKKILKTFLLIIIVLIIILSIGGVIYYNYWRNSNTVDTFSGFNEPQKIDYNNIYWKNDSIGNELIEKASFFVKVRIEGINGDLYMQFDSGTQTTVLYGKTLNQLKKVYPNLKTIFTRDSIQYLKNVKMCIGQTKFESDKIKILQSMGNSTIDSTFNVIGSIGFDAFVGRTLILDFKSNKIAITNKKIKEINPTLNLVQNASVNRFPLLIPAKIGDKKTKLFYDSGSSMFAILTSEKNLENLKGVTKSDTLCCVQNWDKHLKVIRKKMAFPIQIGNITQSNQFVYGISILKIADYFPNWFFYGITGNKLFDKKIIMIDNKNNEMGISN